MCVCVCIIYMYSILCTSSNVSSVSKYIGSDIHMRIHHDIYLRNGCETVVDQSWKIWCFIVVENRIPSILIIPNICRWKDWLHFRHRFYGSMSLSWNDEARRVARRLAVLFDTTQNSSIFPCFFENMRFAKLKNTGILQLQGTQSACQRLEVGGHCRVDCKCLRRQLIESKFLEIYIYICIDCHINHVVISIYIYISCIYIYVIIVMNNNNKALALQ